MKNPDALIELFNNVLAGKSASDELGEALSREWLPAVARFMSKCSPASPDAQLARRFLIRLGWLLQHLPGAASIHAGLLDRALRECRSDWRALAPSLFADNKLRMHHIALLDRELLDPLVAGESVHAWQPAFNRRPIAPVVNVAPRAPAPVHPHDREASGKWQAVLTTSRGQRRVDDDAPDALARVSCLRAGDRVVMLLPGGLRETWRVLRRETARDNVLLENESNNRQGVLGLQTMAAQLAEGRLAILA